MTWLRAVLKLGRALPHIVVGFLTIVLLFGRLDVADQQARVQAWARRLLELLDIGLTVRGERPTQGPMLLVANHISWLDIVVMHAARHCRFVAKADVKHWPLISTLATGSGTLYIERESRRDAMRVVHRMAESLRAGDILAVFPEGTTSDGTTLLAFHANLIQAAISADVPVQPVALQFVDSDSGRIAFSPCYVGDDTLAGSVWRTLCGPPLTAVVSYGAPQKAQGRDRRSWAAALRDEVVRLRP